MDDLVVNRFWHKVDIRSDSECWLWKAGGSPYGRFWDGVRYVSAHRFAYSISNPIPEGLNILHLCNNSLCVNPKHLRPGTQSDNMEHKILSGNNHFGGGQHKFSEADKGLMKWLYAYGVTQKYVASVFGSCQSHMSTTLC